MDTRTLVVSGAYIMSGLRMGLGGVMLAVKGHLGQELPRYRSVPEVEVGQEGGHRGQPADVPIYNAGKLAL